MRRVWVARRSTTAGTVVGGAVQTRKTAPTPRSAGVERFRRSEVARHDLDGRRQPPPPPVGA